MPYRIKATSEKGGALSVLVDTLEAARIEFACFREAGYRDLEILDLDGRPLSVEEEPQHDPRRT